MPFDPVYLLYGAIFLGALLLAEGVFYLIIDSKDHKNANRRMNLIAAGADPSDVLATLLRKPASRWDAFGVFGGPLKWFDQLLTRSGVTISITRLVFLMVGLTILVFAGCLVALQSTEIPKAIATYGVAVFLSLTIGFGLPLVVLIWMRNARLKKFAEQLPDTLDIMVRSLHAGHPVSAAMDLVTKEMPDPIGSEFGIAVDEMTYGLDLRTALENLGDRVGVEDFQYVVVSINIQHDTGGNLAEVLSNLSAVIRARFRMFKKIRALSGEGRVSAYVLTALPIIVLAVILVGSPRFYGEVMNDPWFWPGFGIALGLLLLGVYMMYKMVNFRV